MYIYEHMVKKNEKTKSFNNKTCLTCLIIKLENNFNSTIQLIYVYVSK